MSVTLYFCIDTVGRTDVAAVESEGRTPAHVIDARYDLLKLLSPCERVGRHLHRKPTGITWINATGARWCKFGWKTA